MTNTIAGLVGGKLEDRLADERDGFVEGADLGTRLRGCVHPHSPIADLVALGTRPAGGTTHAKSKS